jgi:hypothetical protein
MANPNDAIKQMQEAMRLTLDHIQKSEKASKGLAENFGEFHRQITPGHATILDYLKSVPITLPKPFQEVSLALTRTNEDIKKAIAYLQNEKQAAKDLLAEAEKSQKAFGSLEKWWSATKGAMYAREQIASIDSLIKLETKRLSLKKDLHALTGKSLAVEYLVIRGWKSAYDATGELNKSLINANSALDVRKELVTDIYQTQIQTGASLERTTGASRALASVWPKMRSDFGSVLNVMLQMEQGLGVSFEHSAQLARIFEVSLRTPVREVADQITIITNSTSLAADQATQFATQLGIALRTMGATGAQAKDVASYVTMMAGRMQDAGGDAAEVVKMFTKMTGGTAESFMLRGLAGIRSPGALTGPGGAQAAFAGITRVIDMFVKAAPGTNAYVAQLQMAANVLDTTTENVQMFRRMMEEANKPLDEHATLQKRWEEQTRQANEAFGRLEHSLSALVHRALMPLLPGVTYLFDALAKFISWVGSSQAAIYTTFALLTAGLVKTTIAAARLGTTLMGISGGPAALLRGGMGALAGLGPLLGVAAAGSIGYAVGTALDRWGTRINSPSLWAKLFTYLGTISTGLSPTHYASMVARKATGDLTQWEVMAHVRRAMTNGDMAQAARIFETESRRIKGFESEEGARKLKEMYAATATDVRERQGLLSVKSERDAREADLKMIAALQATLKEMSSAKDMLRDKKAEDRLRNDMRNAETHEERMRAANRLRLLYDENAPRKSQLEALHPQDHP